MVAELWNSFVVSFLKVNATDVARPKGARDTRNPASHLLSPETPPCLVAQRRSRSPGLIDREP